MRISTYFKSQTIKSSPINRKIIAAYILVLVISLIFSPTVPATAQSGTDQVQNPPYRSFIPIIMRIDRTHYVSPVGNDSNPGTFYQPWRTIRKAASNVEPGDTIYIRSGTYYESAQFEISGTPSNPIRILAYPGENPIVDGGNTIPGPGSALLWFVGNYIYASGIEIHNSAYQGVLVLGDYDVIDNFDVHHCKENGIMISRGHNSIVQNSRIWRNSLSNEYGQGIIWATGISAARSGVSYATIRHNTVWENWGEGISTFEADHTVIEDNTVHDSFSENIYISDATNVLVQRNFVYTNPNSYVFPYGYNDGIALGDEIYTPPSANITIINNISFGNHGNFWWWQGSQGGGMNNVLIANNTFINALGDRSHGEGNVILSPGTHQNVRFENNLVQQDGDLDVIATGPQAGITYSHNLWSKPPVSAASGPGDIIADPILSHVDDHYDPRWFSLSSVSPALDKALILPDVTVDFFDNTREVPPDIGADEFFPTP